MQEGLEQKQESQVPQVEQKKKTPLELVNEEIANNKKAIQELARRIHERGTKGSPHITVDGKDYLCTQLAMKIDTMANTPKND